MPTDLEILCQCIKKILPPLSEKKNKAHILKSYADVLQQIELRDTDFTLKNLSLLLTKSTIEEMKLAFKALCKKREGILKESHLDFYNQPSWQVNLWFWHIVKLLYPDKSFYYQLHILTPSITNVLVLNIEESSTQ